MSEYAHICSEIMARERWMYRVPPGHNPFDRIEPPPVLTDGLHGEEDRSLQTVNRIEEARQEPRPTGPVALNVFTVAKELGRHFHGHVFNYEAMKRVVPAMHHCVVGCLVRCGLLERVGDTIPKHYRVVKKPKPPKPSRRALKYASCEDVKAFILAHFGRREFKSIELTHGMPNVCPAVCGDLYKRGWLVKVSDKRPYLFRVWRSE